MEYKTTELEIGLPGIIGCSMLGSIAGVSPWQSEQDVLDSFRGKKKDIDMATAKRFWLGHHLEGVIADYVAEDLGVELEEPQGPTGKPMAWYREDMPYFVCHPDRIIKGEYEGKRTALEIKTASAHSREWGEEGTDDIPAQYVLQCTGYVACGVADAVLVAVMRDNRIGYYRVEPDEGLVQSVIEMVARWHEKAVDPDYVPDPDSYEEAIARTVLKKDTKKTATPEIELVAKQLRELQEQVKDLEGVIDERKKELVTFMDGYQKLVDAGGKTLCSIVSSTRSTFDKKALFADHPELDDPKYYKTSQSTFLR